MSTETNQAGGAQPQESAGEGQSTQAAPQTVETIAIPKADYDKLNETVGSLKREIKDLKKAKETTDTPQPTAQQSNEPDYARLAFLNSNQVTHPDDQKFVLEEATRLQKPLTEVLGMAYVKAELAKFNDTRVTQAASPTGQGRTGGPNKGEVEYYLAHPDEVPADLELHNKVIDAKLKREENANKFASVPFIG